MVEEVLSEFISNGHIEVSRLTLGVGRAKLAAALGQLYREVRGQGLSFPELAAATATSHASEDDRVQTLSALDDAMKAFFAVPRKTPAARANYDEVSIAWSTLRPSLDRAPDYDTLADFCQAIESFRVPRPSKTGNLKDHIGAVDALIWDKPLLGRLPQVCLDTFARTYALEMVSLLTEIDKRLAAEKAKFSALDFDDLQIRTLDLLANPTVLARATERYKFFLVDEFQDTNGLQRQLLERLTMSTERGGANLFIVGDRKQSVYGFRGADVDVFRETTRMLVAAGGEERPLLLNFRSQPPLINFFNYLFQRLFQPSDDVPSLPEDELSKLGFVPHEQSEAKREQRDPGPLVELLIATRNEPDDSTRTDQDFRELDAEQVGNRILQLKLENPDLKFSDIALLFRAMTLVHFYESALRRLSIPYQTVLGRGFYDRQEIIDLIQLLRFLDNQTDELALAAVLRSPLCGLSDNALFALRSAPRVDEAETDRAQLSTRPLYSALRQHRELEFINEQEHELLDRAASLINRLVARRHHYTIEDLLRFAVAESEYFTVIAANFDGAQRLANVHRLFTLAARYERSGNHLIRDFVRYVEEFEAIGARESEGQMDEAANAVKLMTIHQAKGLEFPVVVIPELHRSKNVPEFSFTLDRHRGLTLKVPDGRGNRIGGRTFKEFEERQAWREQFESMRLLYVAATRAEDRLILSGATEEVGKLSSGQDSWLKKIWQALGLEGRTLDTVIDLDEDVQIKLTLNLPPVSQMSPESVETDPDDLAQSDSLTTVFPLLNPVEAQRDHAIHRFSVTQLINYQRCPRQYYFDRVLQLPSADELAVWNNADAPEPPANLTATLKGAVIHRFCERYSSDQNVDECLRQSFDEVVQLRQAELADRLVEINTDQAIAELMPLAMNYLQSAVFLRVEEARHAVIENGTLPAGATGLWSELSFRLRRPLGVVSGVIDKLLITQQDSGEFEVEIIDFKTNRIAKSKAAIQATKFPESSKTQFAFDFDAKAFFPSASQSNALQTSARDYQLQMQAYALAIRELIPSLSDSKIKVTLHFLEPNLEFNIADELLESRTCETALDSAMLDIVASSSPEHFPVRPAVHCRMCNFLKVCAAG
ncbi:MAG: hypothetical protein DMF69_12435, partial [Acidobacteria bacterium]